MKKKIVTGFAWVIWGLMLLATAATAAGPDAVGSLVGSRNATLDGQPPLPHTVLLNGDKVAVDDGLAMVMLDRGNRMILGRDSEVVFLRESGQLTVQMARGTLSLYHPAGGSSVRVKAGDVTVAPAGGPGALGELSLEHGLLMVTARDGSLKVEKGGSIREVAKGHIMTLATTSIDAPGAAPGVTLPASSHAAPGTTAIVGAALGGGGATVASLASSRSSRQVSPVTPGP